MTEKYISNLLKKLNKNSVRENIFIRPLSENIDYALVWEDIPKIDDNILNNYPFPFYLIKNENEYVGAVLNMQHDLHWYIRKKDRGKGCLTNALKYIIIPHLFLKKSKQRITISEKVIGVKNATASRKVALNLRFKKINETSTGEEEYVLLRKNHKEKYPFEKIKGTISEDRLKILKKRINYAAKILWLVQAEFEMKYYQDAGLKKDVEKIKKYIWKLEDIWWDNKS